MSKYKLLTLFVLLFAMSEVLGGDLSPKVESEIFFDHLSMVNKELCESAKHKWDLKNVKEFDILMHANCLRLGVLGKRQYLKALNVYSQLPLDSLEVSRYRRSVAKLLLGDSSQMKTLKELSEISGFTVSSSIARIFEEGIGTRASPEIALDLWKKFHIRGNSIAGCHIKRISEANNFTMSRNDIEMFEASNEFLLSKDMSCDKFFRGLLRD